jgi:hypothetical protein
MMANAQISVWLARGICMLPGFPANEANASPVAVAEGGSS